MWRVWRVVRVVWVCERCGYESMIRPEVVSGGMVVEQRISQKSQSV